MSDDRMKSPARGVLQLIGDTPLISLPVDAGGKTLEVMAKAEFFNPTGSHKDRIYLHMIKQAEKRSELSPGMTIIEGSTGNAGAACAMVGSQMGYRVVVVMPEGMSRERKQLIEALGAELITTPGAESDQDLSLRRVEEILARQPDRYWYPAQFDNPDNPQAHYQTTAVELWQQSSGKLDALVLAVGSGGTLTGLGRYLTKQDPDISIYAVEPEECPILSQKQWGSHEIQGIGDGFVPGNLDLSLIDGVITVSSEEAVDSARQLCREQGLLVGISTGCNMAAISKLAQHRSDLDTVGTMLFDNGHKYFSSALFGKTSEVDIPDRDHSLPADIAEKLDKHRQRWEIIG